MAEKGNLGTYDFYITPHFNIQAIFKDLKKSIISFAVNAACIEDDLTAGTWFPRLLNYSKPGKCPKTVLKPKWRPVPDYQRKCQGTWKLSIVSGSSGSSSSSRDTSPFFSSSVKNMLECLKKKNIKNVYNKIL